MKMKHNRTSWIGWIPIMLLLMLFASSGAWAQTKITGKVTEADTNVGLPGVTVLVKGTQTGSSTDIEGNFAITLPAGATTLVFSYVGFLSQEVEIGNRTVVNVSLKPDVTALSEVVVLGYTTQEKKDLTGSVAIVSAKDLQITPAGNLQQQLQGRAAGVTVSGSGAPGEGAKVRVRGFGSFGNADPLYIIDGVPTQNVVNLNPNDIESFQVLKDAAAASIYGSRGANGVVVITTKQGKAGKSRITVDSYYGFQNVPKSVFPQLLNTQELGELKWQSFLNAGQAPLDGTYGSGPRPTIPDFLVAGNVNAVNAGHPAVNRSLYNIDPNRGPIYQITPANKEGTDWYDVIFRTGAIQSHQVSANGGSDAGTYSLGFNYFDQQGTLEYTNYRRLTGRANTSFNVKKNIRVGENLQVSFEDRQGGNNLGEGGAIAQAYRMPPIVPVYDIEGNWAGTRGGNLGNGSNPLADLWRAKDNLNYVYRIFGNVYAEADFLKHFTARTSFGVDYGHGTSTFYGWRTYERSENTSNTSFSERNDWSRSWTWTNTIKYTNTIADVHRLSVIAGTEAIKIGGRGIGAARLNYYTDQVDFRTIDAGASDQTNFGYAFREALFSIFARADYTLKDKYIASATVRRDGSSKFGIDNRYAVFPAFSLGWRISEEDFLKGNNFVSDLKLRAGWGQMGNQNNVNAANQYSFYAQGPNRSFYDISGTNTTNGLAQGFDLDRIGNTATKWETSTTLNIGIDAVVLENLTVSAEWYDRRTEGLLVTQQAPLTAPRANQPAINIGDMRNRGIDLTLGYKGNVSDFRYDAMLTFSHYKNEALKLQESDDAFFVGGNTRFGDVTRTQAGQPISSFFGYRIAGFFNNEGEIANSPAQAVLPKRVGGWRLVDVNGDGVVDANDQSFIGSPHPVFQSGINLNIGWKNFDFTAFLFWNYGNKLFNYNRWWIDFNSFQGNRSREMLYDSWRPDNQNASLPRLDASDNQSGNLSSDYYLESGSFLRMRTMQLSYTVPAASLNKLGVDNARIYVQGQNLFTITKYRGLDPDITIQQDDLGMGVDRGIFPAARMVIFGLNLTF